MNQEDNTSKSRRGSQFNADVLKVLNSMRKAGLIDAIDMKKRFPFSSAYKKQFHAPFLLTKDNNKILIFKMTSMRSDRNKENLWDAFGIKNYFKGGIKVILVLPDFLSEAEVVRYLREKKKNKQEGYYSTIDEMCQLSELSDFVKRL